MFIPAQVKSDFISEEALLFSPSSYVSDDVNSFTNEEDNCIVISPHEEVRINLSLCFRM